MNLHDAQSGFHDIKPLPEFSPFPVIVLWLFCVLVAIGVAIVLWMRRNKEQGSSTPSAPPIPDDQQALADLQELEMKYTAQKIALRELGSSSSLVLRTYLARSLQFPATELTNREVKLQLPMALERKLPVASDSQKLEIERSVERLLKFFERITFAAGAEQAFDAESSTVLSRLGDAKECVKRIASGLAQERERTASVVDHSRSKPISREGAA